jgi:hypothetical protein
LCIRPFRNQQKQQNDEQQKRYGPADKSVAVPRPGRATLPPNLTGDSISVLFQAGDLPLAKEISHRLQKGRLCHGPF